MEIEVDAFNDADPGNKYNLEKYNKPLPLTKRNPLLIILLSIITGSLYWYYWQWRSLKELSDHYQYHYNGHPLLFAIIAKLLGAFLPLATILNHYYLYSETKKLNQTKNTTKQYAKLHLITGLWLLTNQIILLTTILTLIGTAIWTQTYTNLPQQLLIPLTLYLTPYPLHLWNTLRIQTEINRILK